MSAESAPVETGVRVPLHKPGSFELAGNVFNGILISVPMAFFFEVAFRNYLSFFIPNDFVATAVMVSVVAPIVEEFTKVFPLVFRHAETPRSIVLLGSMLGLGFGVAEFFVYVYAVGAPPLVRVPEMIFHSANTAIVAYGAATGGFAKYYLLAVFLHFSNNFLALAGDVWYVGSTIALVYAVYEAFSLYNRAPDGFLE